MLNSSLTTHDTEVEHEHVEHEDEHEEEHEQDGPHHPCKPHHHLPKKRKTKTEEACCGSSKTCVE